MKFIGQFLILIAFLPNAIFSTGVIHEKILTWWNKVSEQKPFHCETNAVYSKPFHPAANEFIDGLKLKPMITSRFCEFNDTTYLKHNFKGAIKNGQFDGPGKLKIPKETQTYFAGELHTRNVTCLDIG